MSRAVMSLSTLITSFKCHFQINSLVVRNLHWILSLRIAALTCHRFGRPYLTTQITAEYLFKVISLKTDVV